MIRNQIVFEINDKKVRERWLKETVVTLVGVVKIYYASELAMHNVETFG